MQWRFLVTSAFVNFSATASNRFTYTFPIVFGGDEISFLQCIFEKLKPANTQLIFNQV